MKTNLQGIRHDHLCEKFDRSPRSPSNWRMCFPLTCRRYIVGCLKSRISYEPFTYSSTNLAICVIAKMNFCQIRPLSTHTKFLTATENGIHHTGYDVTGSPHFNTSSSSLSSRFCLFARRFVCLLDVRVCGILRICFIIQKHGAQGCLWDHNIDCPKSRRSLASHPEGVL